jgi:hypothetical protein
MAQNYRKKRPLAYKGDLFIGSSNSCECARGSREWGESSDPCESFNPRERMHRVRGSCESSNLCESSNPRARVLQPYPTRARALTVRGL